MDIKFKRDWILILLIILSLGLILYSGLYLINYYSINEILIFYPENLDRNGEKLEPNEIGDSIGGILNPIIGFTAAILTFLAFYIQFKANQELKENIQKTKNEELKIEKNNHNTNIRIFKILITDMVKYYRGTGKMLIEFVEFEKAAPLNQNKFTFFINSSYDQFQKLDFKDLYSSIVFSFNNKNLEWENEFIFTLNNINFYQKEIEEFKLKFGNHIKSKSDNLNMVGRFLTKEFSELLNHPVIRNFEGVDEYLRMMTIINSEDLHTSLDSNFSNLIDYEVLQNDFFNQFLKRLYLEYNTNKDPYYFELLNKFSFENKRIGDEKLNSVIFANSLKERYNKYFLDETRFEKIEAFIDKVSID